MSAAREPFQFPQIYYFPPFYTPQPHASTRRAQQEKWSALILEYARYHRLFKLSLSDALETELFHNKALRRRLSYEDAKEIVESMRKEGRAEWIGKSSGSKIGDASGGVFWVWWKTTEEWAEEIADWVNKTGQNNTVLTLYELTEGEATTTEEFHGLPTEVLQKALAVLVKRGKAQVFGQDDQQGVKFF